MTDALPSINVRYDWWYVGMEHTWREGRGGNTLVHDRYMYVSCDARKKCVHAFAQNLTMV
jgi:hypothetical protein